MSLAVLNDLPAPAKINLFLHVVGRRADGYHLLQSVFVPIDWADTLHVERLPGGRLERVDLGPALPADDLCLRAARALQQASGTDHGARISILKRLPSGAGMGGGSSDAATVLIALNRLWGLHWRRPRLAALGLALGADVPFFLGRGPAFVEGIGEQITPMALPVLRLAVVKPPQSLPTPEIFGHPALKRDTEPVIVAGSSFGAAQAAAGPDEAAGAGGAVGWPVEWGDPGLALNQRGGFGRNDLQPPAEDRCSAVADAVAWLVQRHGNGRMTGSGSAVFALLGAEGRDGAVGPALAIGPSGQALEGLPPGWVGRMCRSLQALPLAGWLED
jgi:4-diphosphocytidyl-2-C-methyl-D-erythritol kinase